MKIVGFNKKQKKKVPICRLFAVCHRRQRALCRLPRTAKKPRGNHLCFLAADPFGQFAYSGRRQRLCRPWQTAKNLHFAISGRRQRTCHLVTCRWHHTADGKDTRKFAVRWQTAKALESLPSAADGKEPVAVGGRRQRACIASFSVFSYTQPFSQQIDDTYIFFTWQVHNKRMGYPTHIISS